MVAILDSYCNNNNNKIADLNGWIGKVKKKLRREKHKNLRLEVILSNTLTMAQIELRQKQLERKMKWIHMKKSMDDPNSEQRQDIASRCEELVDLDNFMLQLKTIKQPIVR